MINKKYLEIEAYLTKWVVKNRVFILCYLFSLLIIYLCFLIPYINIVINKNLGLFLAVASAILIFRIEISKIALFSVLLFLISIPLVLIKEYARAEEIINLVYGIILVGLIPNLFKLRNEK